MRFSFPFSIWCFSISITVCSFNAEEAGTVMAVAQLFTFLKTWVETGDNMLIFGTGYRS